MTATGGAALRSDNAPLLRSLPMYPFLALFAYLPFILYMHRSKIGPRGLGINSLGEQITYYHADLLLYVLVAGLLFVAKPLRRWSLLVFTALYYLAAFDWFSWHTQSKSFFFADLYRAVQLVVYYPEFVNELSFGIKARAAFLFALPLFVAIGFRTAWISQLANRFQRPLGALSGLLILCILAPTPWLVSSTYAHQNSIVHMMTEQLHDRKLASITADRATMKTVLGHDDPALPAFAHTDTGPTGDNVIIFIIETAPFPDYPDLGELAATLEHPWLKQNSVVFDRHYGTYPASDRASYSILSGLYPPMLHHNSWKGTMHYGDSLPKALAGQGYTSYLFSTAPLAFYDDDLMYEGLGFTHLREVEEAKTLRVKTKNGYQWDRSRLYEMDEELIRMVIDTLQEHRESGKGPFMASIAPQSSHAPFNCPPESREDPQACQSELDKLRSNALWQFGLIERLIKALEASGMLDNTVLVITGDHGIRSKHETASFPNPNLLQQITFHVPLMIAASRLADAPEHVGHPTSHVDIVPTVLDLLGVPRSDFYFHGRNLFATSPRSLYLIGTGYSPATGFLRDDRFFMENRSNDLFLSAPVMDFNDRKQVTEDNETRRIISDELLRLEAFLRRENRATVEPD